MSLEAKMSGSQVKICVICHADVSKARRFKTPGGDYYCATCYQSAAAANTAPAPAPAAALEPSPMAAVSPEPTPAAERNKYRTHGLVSQVICPHCWHQFAPDEVMWIAGHSDLIGDHILGAEKPRRFVPSRFTVNGQALDGRGVVCQQLACPRCHLILPRAVVESEPLFVSIIGGPKTGKSYLLSAMTCKLRESLPSVFSLSFNDADPVANQTLIDYEATLFHPEDREKLVALPKTEESGELYDATSIGGHTVLLPRPFLFNVHPTTQHAHINHPERVSRVICMYDNAGESYQPGKDSMTSPATQHLAMSKALMFVFDPTQDSKFRDKCRAVSEDPQLTSGWGTQRQSQILNEAASRVRRYTNLPPGKQYDRPLIVIVTKSDIWKSLIDEDLVTEPFLPSTVPGKPGVVDVVRIERVSKKIEAMLRVDAQELVTAATDFCKHVVFMPISPLGQSPEETALPGGGKGLFVRPKNITPRWAAVPVLYMFAKWTKGLVSGNISAARSAGTRASSN